MFISSRGGIASRIAVLCIAALQGACTTTAEVGTLDDAMHEGYTPLNEEKWAIEQADIFHKEFLEKGLLYNDPDMQSYLNQIEKSLLSNRTDIQERIKLFVLKSPSPNAVAWPNGNIYIHAGLFSPVETDDQLAAVISHEMAHITQKHSVKAIISQKNTLIGAHIGDFATGGLGLVYSGAFANIMDFSRARNLRLTNWD